MNKIDSYLDKVMPYLAALFLFFGIVFFATNSFAATSPPSGSLKGELSQNVQCLAESEADVVKVLGEGIVLRGPALSSMLSALHNVSGQSAPDMDTLRLYHPEMDSLKEAGYKTWLLVALKNGCVVGAANAPNDMMLQVLQKARSE